MIGTYEQVQRFMNGISNLLNLLQLGLNRFRTSRMLNKMLSNKFNAEMNKFNATMNKMRQNVGISRVSVIATMNKFNATMNKFSADIERVESG